MFFNQQFSIINSSLSRHRPLGFRLGHGKDDNGRGDKNEAKGESRQRVSHEDRDRLGYQGKRQDIETNAEERVDILLRSDMEIEEAYERVDEF